MGSFDCHWPPRGDVIEQHGTLDIFAGGDDPARGHQPNLKGDIASVAHHLRAHYLYEAANALLTTLRSPWYSRVGLKLLKRWGPKRARVAVARKLATFLGESGRMREHYCMSRAVKLLEFFDADGQFHFVDWRPRRWKHSSFAAIR
jgi:hypothetical protein